MPDLNTLVRYTNELPELMVTLTDLQSEVASDNASSFALAIASDKFSALRAYFEAKTIDVTDRPAVGVALLELKKDLAQLEKVRVVLPTEELSESFRKRLFSWLKKNLLNNHAFLVEKKIDPRLLGGIVIYWQGRFIDLSLRTRIEKYFEKRSLAHVSR